MTGPAPIHVSLPISESDRLRLRAGDSVLLSGPIFGARDAAHQRMHDLIQSASVDGSTRVAPALPIDLHGAGIYYVGPAPALDGQVIGSAGPTTSSRMDSYTPALLDLGLKLMVGKGRRSAAVKDAMRRHGAIYLAATGGAAVLLSRRIVEARIVAYADLGTEAIRALELQDFPCTVVIDTTGADLYELGPAAYATSPASQVPGKGSG